MLKQIAEGLKLNQEARQFEMNLETEFAVKTNLLLTAPQIYAVYAIGSAANVKIGEIAKVLGCTRSNLTGIVDRLEEVGLVYRDRSSDDRREVIPRLTEKGQDVLNVALEATSVAV